MNKFYLTLLLILTSKICYPGSLTYKTNDKEDVDKKEKVNFSYNGGLYTPFGIMASFTFSKGHGFYLCGRFNQNIFKNSQYYFKGSAVNDHSLNWVYQNKKIYSRWEINAGAVFRIYQNESGKGLKIYFGGGALQPRYLYSFKKAAAHSVNDTWVEYKEISKFTYNTELGFCFFLNKSFNIQLGISSLTKKYERMITFGFGKELK